MSGILLPLALALLVYPGLIFTGVCLWAAAFLREVLICISCKQGIPSPLVPLRGIVSAFGRPWFVFRGAPNVTATWVATLGLLSALVAEIILPYPGSPLFAINAVGEGRLRPWSLPVLLVLLELGTLSQILVAFMVPDLRALLLGWRRLILFQSYLVPQLLVVTALAVGAGTMDLLQIARSGGFGLTALKLTLSVVGFGVLLARLRVGPFDTDAGLDTGRLDRLLPGQLGGLLTLGRSIVWLASMSFLVFAFLPLPPSGLGALLAWAIYMLVMTLGASLVEAEQPAWHSGRWQRLFWALGVPVGVLSLAVAFVVRGS